MKQIQLPTQVRAASFEASSVNAEKRTVEVVFSTGADVMRMNHWTGERFVESLSLDPAHVRMERLNSGAPVLNAHSKYTIADVIGVVEKAWLKDGEGRAIIRFADTPEVAPVWEKVRQGIVRNVSVGYIIHKFEKTGSSDKSAEKRLITDWEPIEISAVPIGADAGAGFRGAESGEMHACEVVEAEGEGTIATLKVELSTDDATRAIDVLSNKIRECGLSYQILASKIEEGIRGEQAAADTPVAEAEPAAPAEPNASEQERGVESRILIQKRLELLAA